MIEIRRASSALPATDVSAVLRLVADAEKADGVAPLSEQSLLRLDDPLVGVGHLLARRQGQDELIGYAQIDDTATGELVVAPAARRNGVGRALLTAPGGATPVQVWAHGEHPDAAALAARLGYSRTRVLLVLRRPLTTPLPDPRFPAGVTVRTFVVGADESAWLAVNNAAFASHPEQGRWTLHDVELRERLEWFDPKGLFLAERDDEIVGFHWTKVHTEETPPVGEVYVVGVRPQDSGQGLGPALTLVGLHHLKSLGLAHVLLYVDEDNTPAMKTYERLGFRRFGTDVLYART